MNRKLTLKSLRFVPFVVNLAKFEVKSGNHELNEPFVTQVPVWAKFRQDWFGEPKSRVE